MNHRRLLSALLLTGTFACLPMAINTAQAADETVQGNDTRNRELKVGDKAPDQYKRDEIAIKDWKAKGLKEPQKESHWVEMADSYVLVQTTNGVILEISDKTAH